MSKKVPSLQAMNDDPQISSYFPFSDPREEQVRAWDFLNREKKKGAESFVLELPTGVGKSPLAVALGSAWGEIGDEIPGCRHGAHVLTTQRILQSQYERDFSEHGVASVWSKRAYRCQSHDNCSCAAGLIFARLYPEEDTSVACKQSCKYLKAARAYSMSKIGVTNIHFFLNQVTYAPKRVRPRNLLVVDECHNLEDILVGFVQVEIDKRLVERDLDLVWPGSAECSTVAKGRDWVASNVVPALKSLLKQISNEADDAERNGNRNRSLKLRDKWSSVDGRLCSVQRFVDEYDDENWVVNVDEDSWKFQPIEVGEYGKNRLFEYGGLQVLMSGTILDSKLFCRSVGLDPSSVSSMSCDSPFPVANRPVYYAPVGSMGSKGIESTLPELAKAVGKAIDHYAGFKGIVHCHTYRIQNYLMSKFRDEPRAIFHGKDDREAAYEKHLSSSKPTILFSPSMQEGVDLRDDLSRFQFVCKMPYPYLGDARVKTKFDRDKRWYSWVTSRTLMQMTGRSIRTPEDWAHTIVFDSDFESLVSRSDGMIPNWWMKSVQALP